MQGIYKGFNAYTFKDDINLCQHTYCKQINRDSGSDKILLPCTIFKSLPYTLQTHFSGKILCKVEGCIVKMFHLTLTSGFELDWFWINSTLYVFYKTVPGEIERSASVHMLG